MLAGKRTRRDTDHCSVMLIRDNSESSPSLFYEKHLTLLHNIQFFEISIPRLKNDYQNNSKKIIILLYENILSKPLFILTCSYRAEARNSTVGSTCGYRVTGDLCICKVNFFSKLILILSKMYKKVYKIIYVDKCYRFVLHVNFAIY